MDPVQVSTQIISSIIEDIHLHQNHSGLEDLSNSCHQAIQSGRLILVSSDEADETEQLRTHEEVTNFVERILSMSQHIG